jgi:hypothetical protein
MNPMPAILSLHKLTKRVPEQTWRFMAVDVPYREVLEQEMHILQLIAPLE